MTDFEGSYVRTLKSNLLIHIYATGFTKTDRIVTLCILKNESHCNSLILDCSYARFAP